MVGSPYLEGVDVEMNMLDILVVDDDPINLTLLENRLTKAGYHIEVARNGQEAIDLVSLRCFDVVLTDLVMPEKNGINVLEATKTRCSRTEVILFTAYATVDSALEAMKKGAADYLAKPINFDELMLRLGKIETLKTLVKNVDDLREAMTITEDNAAQTIHHLEYLASNFRQAFVDLGEILTQENMEAPRRIHLALEVLSRLRDTTGS
jgi:DNA-binding NtrC family response regulator